MCCKTALKTQQTSIFAVHYKASKHSTKKTLITKSRLWSCYGRILALCLLTQTINNTISSLVSRRVVTYNHKPINVYILLQYAPFTSFTCLKFQQFSTFSYAHTAIRCATYLSIYFECFTTLHTRLITSLLSCYNVQKQN